MATATRQDTLWKYPMAYVKHYFLKKRKARRKIYNLNELSVFRKCEIEEITSLGYNQ
jgi:hypothetical protein